MTTPITDEDRWLRELIKQAVNLDEIESALRAYMLKPRPALTEGNSPAWYSYYFVDKAEFEEYLETAVHLVYNRNGIYILYD